MRKAIALLLALLSSNVAAGRDEDLPPGALLRLGAPRPCHASTLTAVAYAPDGKSFLSTGRDGALRVWDALSGRLRRELSCGQSYAFSVACSPDSAWIAAAGQDSVVRVWEAATGELRWDLREHQDEVHSVAFSPDGRFLASGGTDGDARVLLWDLDSGTVVKTMEGLSGLTMGLAFSPDGLTLAAGDYASGEASTLRTWEVASEKELLSIPRGSIDLCASDVVFSPDGALIATGIEHGVVCVWDVATGEVRARLEGHQRHVVALAWSPDGGTLASGAYDRKIRLWDTRTWQPLTSFTADAEVIYSLSFSPDGDRLLSAGRESAVRSWEVPEGREQWFGSGHAGAVKVVAISPDSRTLASGGADGTVRTWDLETGTERQRIHGGAGEILSLAYATEGQLVFSREGEHSIHVFDVATGKDVRVLDGHTDVVSTIAVSSDLRHVLSGGRDGKVFRWELATGECRSLMEGASAIRAVAISADGMTRAWAESGGRVNVFRTLPNGWEVGSSLGYSMEVCTLAFLPGGALLAMGGKHEEIHVYSFDHPTSASGTLRLALQGQSSHTTCLAATPDGKFLASVDASGRARLWEVWTGAEACRFDGRGLATCVAIGPAGAVLATGQADSSVLVWEILSSREGDVEAAWGRLAEADARAGYEAMGVLIGAGNRAGDLLTHRLTPAESNEARFQTLIAELDDDSAPVREAASLELAKLRSSAEGALRDSLERATSPEVRTRLEEILRAPADPLPVPAGGALQALRGIQVLERLGAREALIRLAEGDPGSRETREARAALDRLEKRR